MRKIKHTWKVYHWINGAWFYLSNVLAVNRKDAIARGRRKHGIPAKDKVRAITPRDEAIADELDTLSTNTVD